MVAYGEGRITSRKFLLYQTWRMDGRTRTVRVGEEFSSMGAAMVALSSMTRAAPIPGAKYRVAEYRLVDSHKVETEDECDSRG